VFGKSGEEFLVVDLPINRSTHQRDTTARGVHLSSKDCVGRARLQAQPTVNAFVQQLTILIGEHIGDL
jgi:hypothetical protein